MFNKLYEIIKKKSDQRVYYITDNANWVLDEIGTSLRKEFLNYDFNFSIKKWKDDLRKGIIHFSNRYNILNINKNRLKNKIVLTYFHGDESDKHLIKKLFENEKKLDIIHTSCSISRQHLEKIGINKDKIVVIPIGVNVSLFSSVTDEEKQIIRSNLGIPEGKIVIGSFQKDGNGWGEGETPKLIKGPDVFCDALIELNKNYPIFVLLTGPARGYVKKRLSDAGIPHSHYFLKDYNEISLYYKVLDLYIIASRLEGGPKAIMESHAAGVPLVSTNVGMAPEVISHSENGFLAEIEDIKSIVKYSESIINDDKLRKKLVCNGLNTVTRYDWSVIASEYYKKIYKRLFD